MAGTLSELVVVPRMMARRGRVRRGGARSGSARRGAVWHGEAWQDKVKAAEFSQSPFFRPII
jgi:hypothetical protein